MVKVAVRGNGIRITTANTTAPMSRDFVYNRSFSIPISVNVNMLLITVRTKYPRSVRKINPDPWKSGPKITGSRSLPAIRASMAR